MSASRGNRTCAISERRCSYNLCPKFRRYFHAASGIETSGPVGIDNIFAIDEQAK